LADRCFCACVDEMDEIRNRKEIIKRKNSELLTHVEPDFELLDNLTTKDVFTDEAIGEIKAEKTKRDRVEKMLFHLRYVEEGGYNSFLEALRDSSQAHIVNFINGTYLYYIMHARYPSLLCTPLVKIERHHTLLSISSTNIECTCERIFKIGQFGSLFGLGLEVRYLGLASRNIGLSIATQGLRPLALDL